MVTIHIVTSTKRRFQIRMRVTGKNEVYIDIPSKTSIDLIAGMIADHTRLIKKSTEISYITIPSEILPKTPVFYFGIEMQAGAVVNFGHKKSITKKQFYEKVSGELEREIANHVSQFRAMMSIPKIGKISYKLLKSQWGSCTHTGNLSFNKRLIHYPTECIEYVVVHELAHIHQHNHSRAFWQIVKHYYPDFNKYRAILKKRMFG